MFGDKKDKNKGSNQDNFSANTIQSGTTIQGEVVSDGSIRIDGVLDGSIRTKGKLVVGASGVITGDVVCQDANIEGKINGTVQVAEILILKQSAVIEGDVVTKKLVVEEGAIFNGKISSGSKLQKNISTDAERTIQKEAV